MECKRQFSYKSFFFKNSIHKKKVNKNKGKIKLHLLPQELITSTIVDEKKKITATTTNDQKNRKEKKKKTVAFGFTSTSYKYLENKAIKKISTFFKSGVW